MAVGVIVCTLNRPRELRECLGAIRRQTLAPRVVVIVDASTERTFEANAETIAHCADASKGVEFVHLSAPQGLTHQRNLGASVVKRDAVAWVQFVDDDVILAKDYLERIDRLFDDPAVIGAEGRDANLRTQPRRMFRLLYPRLNKSSGLSKTGHNWFPEGRSAVVDWLSGCAPAYRCDILAELAFDERRAGNGMGEDVDFSFRAGRLGNLRHDPEAVYQHRPSHINRASGADLARQVVVHRGRLATDFPRSFTTGWVRYGLLVEGVWCVAAASCRRDRQRRTYGVALMRSAATRKGSLYEHAA